MDCFCGCRMRCRKDKLTTDEGTHINFYFKCGACGREHFGECEDEKDFKEQCELI